MAEQKNSVKTCKQWKKGERGQGDCWQTVFKNRAYVFVVVSSSAKQGGEALCRKAIDLFLKISHNTLYLTLFSTLLKTLAPSQRPEIKKTS